MKNPSTTNISDQLACIDWAFDAWLKCAEGSEKQNELSNYLGTLLVEFARSNPPSVLLPEEHDHFMSISSELCNDNA